MLKRILIFIIFVLSTGSRAEIFKNENDLKNIFEEFEKFARSEFLQDYLLPVNMTLKITGAAYTPMNGRAGFRNNLDNTVGKPDAVRAQITLSFSKYNFYENYSREGFVWLACHELGHLVGGTPVNEYLKGFSAQEGLTIEGQADYFASETCMGRWLDWVKTHNLSAIEFGDILKSDPFIAEYCHRRFENTSDTKNCEIKLMAAAEGFRLIGENGFKYNKIDKSKTDYMYTAHPKVGCRGSTVFNAVMGFERPSCWFYPEKLKKLDLKLAIEESLSDTIVPKTFCGKMITNLEIIQRNFEKSSWESVWSIKNFKKMTKKHKGNVDAMMTFCKTESLDDSDISVKYISMILEMKENLRF